MNRLKAKIESFKPDALVLDPMSELHSVEENSNTLQRLVTAEIRTIARLNNLAVLLVAHSPKGNVEPGNIAALRGAGAIGAAIRFGYTVCGMSAVIAFGFVQAEEPVSLIGIQAEALGILLRLG
jgi:RecA-family ATPase